MPFSPDVLKAIAPPKYNDKVFKDECMFSFDTPFSPNGIYVSLTNYRAYGQDFVKASVAPNVGRDIFLHIKKKKVPKEGSKETENTSEKGEEDLQLTTTKRRWIRR